MTEIGVYNPDDETLEFKFDGQSYVLDPETVTMIPRAALGVMLSQVGEYGVSPVPVGTNQAELNGLVEEARKKWMVGTRKWAEDILLASLKVNKERREVGIEPIEGPEVIQARGWLQKHGFMK